MDPTSLSKTEMIVVDGAQYDPYYILQVTKDDSDDHIAKSYRKKAKKYHPDKAPTEKAADYMLKFKIVTEAYNYIRNRRLNAKSGSTYHRSKVDQQQASEFDLKRFNDEYERSIDSTESSLLDPNKYGYGEHKHLQKIEEYDEFTADVINQFAGKKFNHDEFNKLFEYNKTIQDSAEDIKALIHKTNDGFNGYNTADVGSCATVHSYNGLMVTGDDYGRSGVGYWGDGYSDYKKTFTGVRNPEKVVQIPTDYKPNEPVIPSKSFEEYQKAYSNAYETQRQPTTFKSEEEILCQRMMDALVEREKQDEAFVMKYAKQYKPEMVRAAMNGELDKSATFLDNLQDHYNVKRIGGSGVGSSSN